MKSLSHVRLFVTPRTVAYQAPPSMGFSRQEYWSGVPFPSPGDLPDPGIEPMSLMSLALASRFFTTSKKVRRVLSNTEYGWGRNNEKKGRKIKRVKELSEFNDRKIK